MKSNIQCFYDQDEEGNVTVHAEADKAWFKAKGYQIADDGWDRTYAIGGMPDVYASEKAACASKGGKWNDTAKSCVIPDPVAAITSAPEQNQESQSEPVADQQAEQQAETYQAPANNIMSLAQSYVGRGGTCDQISWDFIRDEFHSKLLLSALLRTGSSYSANGIVEELRTVLAYMYNRGTIRFRGDSAFYDTYLLEFLENEEMILKDSDKTITMNTFRSMFQKIAVKVVKHAGKISLSFSSAYMHLAQ